MNDALYFLLGRSTVKVLSDSSTVEVKDLGGTTVATKNVANGIVTFILVPGTYTFTSGTKTASVNVGYKKSMTINMMTGTTVAGDTTVVESLTAGNGEPFIFGYDSEKDKYGRVGSNGNFEEFGTDSFMRYNQETDMVQIKGTDGTWHDWKSGGLQEIDLLSFPISDWIVANKVGNPATNMRFEDHLILVNAAASSVANYTDFVLNQNIALDGKRYL